MSDIILQIEKLGKNYGKFAALNDISFSVRKGEIIGLVGPNGAGKTTTLKLIARLIRPNSGEILIQNLNGEMQNIHQKSSNLIEMGYLVDIPNFYNTTPYVLLKHIANIRNYSKGNVKSRIDELLKKFNLHQWKYKKMKNFSKGMIQKVGFLASIIHEPELIILDEPQTGLDPGARIKIREYLRLLQNEKKTILISSHLLNELREVCDKVALINQGTLIGFDTLDNLERNFKIKVIFCEILEPLPQEKAEILIEKLYRDLELYLEKEMVDTNNREAITYTNKSKTFKIRYDGLEASRSEILTILSSKFKSDFTISSFSEPKSSQFESLYSQTLDQNRNEKLNGAE
ncbi:MAG: ABC transporter ATP-binding protein [Candidatus Lokiarchaeota archaeon]|nr:ABC transporter ATP-binding protein [Candidatus Lokiarchaeota archaeon]